MKKIYLFSGAVMISAAMVAQTSEAGKAHPNAMKPFAPHAASGQRYTCGDTAGLSNFTDFLPEFAANSGQATIYGYLGGGYIYGNNVSPNGLKIVAQGYDNLNSTPLSVSGVLAWFGGKESDMGSSATSKVVFSGYDMAPNKAYNTNGSGTINTSVANFEGPSGTAKCSVDLLFADVDTVNFNYVAFPTPANFADDFALVMDVSTLAAGDTVGLVSDSEDDANNLDFAYHKIGTKWYVTDQLFSPAAAPDYGSGKLNNDIALWPVVCDPVAGVTEFYNGMKLIAYPNPAVDNATIEYSLENNSKNVSLVVFDLTGRIVASYSYDSQAAGTYKVDVNAANLAAGSYFYQLRANGHMFTKQLVTSK